MNVIIPTLMLAPMECFYHTLKELVKSKDVTGIVIIDNSEFGVFKKWSKVTAINIHEEEKVLLIENEKNNYVNPSWNQGMTYCYDGCTLFMNDDVFVNGEVIRQVSECMKDNALCSVDSINVGSASEYKTQFGIKGWGKLTTNEKFSQSNNNKCGWFFCVKNDLWEDIPEELKLFYGDDLIFDRVRAKGFTPKNITSCSIGHIGSYTVNKNENVQTILRDEFKIYNRVKKGYVNL